MASSRPPAPPAGLVRAIHAEVNRAQDVPEVKAQMDQLGTDGARTPTPQAFAAMVKADLARFANVVKAAGIKIE